MTLRIAPNLKLPDEAVTQTFAILAKRGMGKTYAGSVMVEEMLERRHRVAVIDPVGVWWGLRSSADGKSAGYPVVILGGERGDLPLEPDAGELVANLVVDQDVPVVLDLSLLRKGQQRRFVTGFLETVYHRNRAPIHVAVDEADAFAPQRAPKGDEARLLGAMEDIVRRGRARGIGVTLITQRAAVLNKNVLTQTETLLAMRMTGPQDRAALDEWVKQHGDEDNRQRLLDGLASLPVGTAWVWSPGWLEVFAKVEIRQRRTYDSSATPKVGEKVTAPKGYADVDLDVLREQMSELVERAEADDPKALRKRIAQLERELAAAENATPETVVETVEVPVLDTDTVGRLEDALRELDHVSDQVSSVRDDINDALARWGSSAGTSPAEASRVRRSEPARSRRSAGTVSPAAAPEDADRDVKLKAGARRMLEVLARPPGIKLTRAQVGAHAGLTPSGGTFTTYLSTLRRHGLIDEQGDAVVITDAGVAAIGEVPPSPRTTDEVLAMWRSNLKAGARRMLDELVATYPHGMTRDELGVAVEIEPSGGTFGTYLSTLKRNGLIDVDGDEITAADALFLAGAS